MGTKIRIQWAFPIYVSAYSSFIYRYMSSMVSFLFICNYVKVLLQVLLEQ